MESGSIGELNNTRDPSPTKGNCSALTDAELQRLVGLGAERTRLQHANDDENDDTFLAMQDIVGNKSCLDGEFTM